MKTTILLALSVVLVSSVGAVELESVDAPDEVDAGEPFEVSATATDAEQVESLSLRRGDGSQLEQLDMYGCDGDGSIIPSPVLGEDECSYTFETSIQSDSKIEVVADDDTGGEDTVSKFVEVAGSSGQYSIQNVGTAETTISPEDTVRFTADVTAPSSQIVSVDWFLRPRGDVVASTSERVYSSESRVSTEIEYDSLSAPPGDYDVAARVATGGDQKGSSRGESVEIEDDTEDVDFGDDISVSIDESPTFVSEGDTPKIEVSAEADSGGLLNQRITLEEQSGFYSEDSSPCEAPDTRPTAQVRSCSASFNYEPTSTGEVTLIAEASTFGNAEDTDTASLTVEQQDDDTPSGDVTLIVDLEDAEGDDMDGGDYTLSGDGQVRQKNGGRVSTRFSGVDASESYDLSVQCGPEIVRENINPSGGDTERVELTLDEASVIDSCSSYPGGDTGNPPGPIPDPDPNPDPIEFPEANLEITPRVGEEGDVFVFDASDSTNAEEFEFDFDGDSFTDETTFGDAVVTERIDDPGENIRAELTVRNGGRSDTDGDFYTVGRDQRPPEAELDVRPDPGTEGEVFTFDASGSRRGQTFRFDFDGDGIYEETTSDSDVERVREETGSFDANVEVSNGAGEDTASETYIVQQRPDPVAEITVLSPLEGERLSPPVQAEISLSQDGSRYECFYDDDSIDVVGSGRDADEDSGSLSGFGNRFEASVPAPTFEQEDTLLFFQCERDDGERTGTKSVSFTVEEEGSAPTARFSISNPSPDVNEQIQFDARSSSDPDGDIANYDFNFGDGFTSSGERVTHSYTDPGVYTVQLVVEDSEGRTDTTTRTVNVQNLSPPPQADNQPSAGFTFAPQIPRAGDTLRLRSTASDPDNDIEFRNWRINTPDGREFDFDTGVRAAYRADESGTYTVTHRVRDDDDNSDSVSRDIIVSEAENSEPSPPPPPQDDSPPEADFIFTPQNPQAGTEVIFQSTATDPDNDIGFRNWRINTPDGREFDFSTGTTARYTPQNEGFYSVTHRVRDSGDRTDTTTRLVQVVGDGGASQQCGVDAGSVSDLDLDPGEVEEGEESEVSVDIDNDGADQDVEVEFVSFDFSTGDFETFDTVNREVEESEEERFEAEIEVDADSRITAEVFTEGDECGDRFIDSDSEILEFSGQQEEDGVVRVSTFTNLGSGVNAFVTLTGPEDRAVNVGGDGERSLTVEPGSYEATARFSGDVRNRNIEVDNGQVRPVSFTFPSGATVQTETASGLTARLDTKEVDAGQRVRVRGDVRGVSGSQTVQLYSEGDRVSTTSSARDGSYTVSFVPNRVGDVSLSVRAADESAERGVRVLPTSSVLSVDAPQQVFEGDQFEVCGRVQTQEEAEVSLLQDGEELTSKSGSGEVCFDATAQNTGENEYSVRSSTYGNGNQRSTTVEVLEDQAEASISTDQVATVETESGTVRVSVYNDNDEKQTYEAEITGIPDTWAETAEKEVVLQPGEEEDIYFYTTPREEGEFNPQVRVAEGGRTVLEESVTLEVGGQKTQEEVSSGVFDLILSRLTPV